RHRRQHFAVDRHPLYLRLELVDAGGKFGGAEHPQPLVIDHLGLGPGQLHLVRPPQQGDAVEVNVRIGDSIYVDERHVLWSAPLSLSPSRGCREGSRVSASGIPRAPATRGNDRKDPWPENTHQAVACADGFKPWVLPLSWLSRVVSMKTLKVSRSVGGGG